MEIQDETHNQNEKKEWQDWYNRNHPPAGRILSGLVLIGVAVVLFMEKMGYSFPSWLFTWKVIIITVGVFIGAKKLFRGFGWLIPIIIGSLFLADDLIPGFAIRPYIWPIIIFLIGLLMIFIPKRKFCKSHPCRNKWNSRNKRRISYMDGKWDSMEQIVSDSGDKLDAVVVFGAQKKNVISKDFKGGEAACVLGGMELNLTQADINGEVILEINAVFGGVKLIIPPHWQVDYQETVSVLGGIEDKRPRNTIPDTNKTIILKGHAVFGGIEINSY